MYPATVYQIMLASPGDVTEEREAAREIMQEWNIQHAKHRNIIIFPLGWEYNTIPEVGNRPQALINKQILIDADLVVGIFWTKIGSPTGTHISGTVEEIYEHINNGKPAMIYFSDKATNPSMYDPVQYAKLQELKQQISGNCLYGTFNSTTEFRDKFRRDLAIQCNKISPLIKSDNIAFIENPQDPVFSISSEAKELLKAATQDGEIISIGYIGGKTIQANGKNYTDSDDLIEIAKWEGALDELEENGYIKAKGNKRQVFAVTHKGYNAVKKLKEAHS